MRRQRCPPSSPRPWPAPCWPCRPWRYSQRRPKPFPPNRSGWSRRFRPVAARRWPCAWSQTGSASAGASRGSSTTAPAPAASSPPRRSNAPHPRATPDGHELLQMDNAQMAAQPFLFKKLPYDLLRDFEPVTPLLRNYFFVNVPAGSRHKTMADLLASAKAAPHQVNYGSWFVGSPGHIGAVMLEMASATRMTHVPYKDMSQLYVAVGNRELDWAFGSAASAGG